MRIITADLINLMNLPEGQTPEFDAKWDLVQKELVDHNSALIENCHPSIKKFVYAAIFFECPVHCRSRDFQNDEYQLVIGVPNTAVYSLHYEIVDDVRVLHHKGAGFDDKDKAIWLYDEFHKIENHYEHHIVFSDGMEMQIPFIFFFCRKQLWFED